MLVLGKVIPWPVQEGPETEKSESGRSLRMDAPPLLRPPRWAVALAVAIAWVGSTAIVRADPLVNNLVSSSVPAARVLSRGAPVVLVSHLEDSYSVLQPADEPEMVED